MPTLPERFEGQEKRLKLDPLLSDF